MLLGKRQRPPIKRTTSMTEFTLDLSNITTAVDGGGGGDANGGGANNHISHQQQFDITNPFKGLDQRFMAAAAVSPSTPSPRPRIIRRNSADIVTDTAHFLRACSLCKRRLIPGRDIYMYRGDSAFCSSECREQQMNLDERKEKCSLVASKKKDGSTIGSTASEVVSTKGETVATVCRVESLAT